MPIYLINYLVWLQWNRDTPNISVSIVFFYEIGGVFPYRLYILKTKATQRRSKSLEYNFLKKQKMKQRK